MDKTEDNKDMAIDSPDQRGATAANDFDITPSPSMASSTVYDKQSVSSRSIQAVRSETERYTIVGNINIMNQMEADAEVLCICYTENYEFLVAGLTNGYLKFYKLATGEDSLTLCDVEVMQNPAAITAVKRRPVRDSITHCVTATYANGCVKCWHHPSEQCLYTIRERRQTLGLAYHPLLPKFVTVGDDANLYLYDEEAKKRERVFHGSISPDVMDGHKSRVFSACFHPRSEHELISGGWDDTVQFWDTRQAHSLRYITGVHMCGDGLDISRDGKEILTCAWQKNNPLQLWDYGSGKLIANLEPDSYPSLLYAGKYVSNQFVACGGCDTDLFRIVDLRSYSTMAMMRHSKGIYSLDVGRLRSKYVGRMKGPELAYLPKVAFCTGSTIFEIDAQYD